MFLAHKVVELLLNLAGKCVATFGVEKKKKFNATWFIDFDSYAAEDASRLLEILMSLHFFELTSHLLRLLNYLSLFFFFLKDFKCWKKKNSNFNLFADKNLVSK